MVRLVYVFIFVFNICCIFGEKKYTKQNRFPFNRLAYVLKVESLQDFGDGLDVWVKGKTGVKGDSKVFA